jgi:hypothetical protein
MFILLQSKETLRQKISLEIDFFVNRKSRFIRIISNHFCGDLLAPKHIFIYVERLFTIVEITVVLPVPAYPLTKDSVVMSIG